MAGQIQITPNTGSTTTDPTIVYQGVGSTSTITQRVTSLGTLTFEGSVGGMLATFANTADATVSKLQVNGLIQATGIIMPTVLGTTVSQILYAGMASNDYFSISVGGTAVDSGYVEIATGDNGTEPIYVRQYNAGTVTRSISLLDGLGNTTFPGTVQASTFIGNASTATKLATTANINGVPFDGSVDVTIGTPSPYYDIHNFINGKPLVNEILMRAIAVRAFNLAANCAGSYAYCTTPATALFQLSLLKNGAEFGTITFNIAATTGVFSSPAATFNVSDQFAIRCKTGAQDSSLSDIAISLLGTA